MILTYGYHKLNDEDANTIVKIAKTKKPEHEDNSGKKALAVGGATAMNGVAGGYSAYKGAKDKENGENHIGRHMIGHGVIVGAGAGLRSVRHTNRVNKAALIAAGLDGLMGAAAGGASYGAGRIATTKNKTKKD